MAGQVVVERPGAGGINTKARMLVVMVRRITAMLIENVVKANTLNETMLAVCFGVQPRIVRRGVLAGLTAGAEMHRVCCARVGINSGSKV